MFFWFIMLFIKIEKKIVSFVGTALKQALALYGRQDVPSFHAFRPIMHVMSIYKDSRLYTCEGSMPCFRTNDQ